MPNTQAKNWINQLEKDTTENMPFLFQNKIAISFAQDYHICKYPVTQGLWKVVMNGENRSRFKGVNPS